MKMSLWGSAEAVTEPGGPEMSHAASGDGKRLKGRPGKLADGGEGGTAGSLAARAVLVNALAARPQVDVGA
jgi:hypothetical protein